VPTSGSGKDSAVLDVVPYPQADAGAIARSRHSGRKVQYPLASMLITLSLRSHPLNTPEARSALNCSRMKRYTSCLHD